MTKVVITGLADVRRITDDFMRRNFGNEVYISDINEAIHKLMADYTKPTRIEMSKDNIKGIGVECGVEFPPEWSPKPGAYVGQLFGIPVYVNNDVKTFVMIGARQIVSLPEPPGNPEP